MRTTRRLFNEDERALRESRLQIRAKFDENKSATDLEPLFADVVDLNEFLTQNVVQGRRNARGNYEVKLTSPTSCNDALRPIS